MKWHVKHTARHLFMMFIYNFYKFFFLVILVLSSGMTFHVVFVKWSIYVTKTNITLYLLHKETKIHSLCASLRDLEQKWDVNLDKVVRNWFFSIYFSLIYIIWFSYHYMFIQFACIMCIRWKKTKFFLCSKILWIYMSFSFLVAHLYINV